MPLPICYLNGAYMPLAQARVSPLDRAFLFGDAVYEVVPVYGSRPFRLRQHLERLDRSLAGIRMTSPRSHAEWAEVCEELITRNAGSDAYIYIQITRGAEFGRNHAWPDGLVPTLFAYISALEPLAASLREHGVSAVTSADTRWLRRDIKSTALLANVLLKKLSIDAGAYETILIDQGELTEGSSTSVHVVTDGIVHAPPNGHHILPGTTRDVITELADRVGLRTISGKVSEAQLRGAEEIWLTFATRGLLPVTTLDGAPVGNGRPGPLFKRMDAAFAGYIHELAGTPAL
ncbi:MAG TPA: aminotransferase class IV [Steroidobacteraceae bacterium]